MACSKIAASARYALDPNRHRSPEDIARRSWPHDEATLALIARAASSLASTTTATALAVEAVGQFLASLAPLSAAASLFAVAPRVSLDGVSTVSFPRRANAIDASAVVWIDEGALGRVPRLDVVGGATLGPAKKLLAIAALYSGPLSGAPRRVQPRRDGVLRHCRIIGALRGPAHGYFLIGRQ